MAESKTHDFKGDLEWGEEKQEEVMEIFKADLANIIQFTESHRVIEGKHKFDVEIQNPKLEIKSRRMPEVPVWEAIENVNVGDENAYKNCRFKEVFSRGWIYESDADWILFYYPNARQPTIRYCDFKELQRAFKEVKDKFDQIINKPSEDDDGNKWCSGFKKIPWRVIREKCFDVGTIYKPLASQTLLTDFVLPNSLWRWKNNVAVVVDG